MYKRVNGTTVKSVLRYYLGPDSKHTVYEAEIVGQILGLHMLLKTTGSVGRTSSYVDNQASIQAIASIKPTPGHHLIDLLHSKHQRILNKHRRANITVRWVPSHEDIKGNEEADKEAKAAASGKGNKNSNTTKLPRELQRILPQSKTAVRMTNIKSLGTQNTKLFRQAAQWPRIIHIDPSLPSNRFKKITKKLNRRQATLLIQLRTGHAPLSKHLYTIKATNSPVCSACNDAHESVHHYLLRCPATEQLRRACFAGLGRAARTLETLLSNEKALKALFRFIGSTRRFKSTFGDDLEIPDEPANT